MTKIQFELDGKQVEAINGETIWQVAKRQGREIPHLCYSPEPDYRPDGNCRACMVEIEGERVLAASCKRTPSRRHEGEIGKRARGRGAEDGDGAAGRRPAGARNLARSRFRNSGTGPKRSRSPKAASRPPSAGRATPAIRRCASISMPASSAGCACAPAARSRSTTSSAWPIAAMSPRSCSTSTIRWANSTCVACGECVQACPTGALMPSVMLDENQTRVVYADRKVDSLCPFCGVGCQVTYQVKDEKIIYAEGRDGPANHNRLCVKGRFGFDYIHHPHRLTKPLVRLPNAKKDANDQVDPANPFTHFREASWEEALDIAAKGLVQDPRREGRQGAGRLRLGQGLERGGLSVPEAGAHRLRLQQCRSLHAAVPRLVGGGADGRPEFRRGVGAVRRRAWTPRSSS